MWQALVTWLAKLLLEAAFKEAVSQALKAENKAKQDALNAENAKKYREANDRVQRISKAVDLLNGNSAP